MAPLSISAIMSTLNTSPPAAIIPTALENISTSILSATAEPAVTQTMLTCAGLAKGAPDITQHSSLQHVLLNTAICSLVLLTVMMAPRMWASKHAPNGLKLSDHILIPAFAFGIVECVLNLVGYHLGAGQHVWDHSAGTTYETAVKLIFLQDIAFITAISLVKFSVVMTFFNACSSRASKIILSLVAVSTFALFTVFVVSETLTHWQKFPNCSLPSPVIWMQVLAIIKTVSSIPLVGLAIYSGNKLALKRQKFAVFALCTLGLLSCVASALRAAFIRPLQPDPLYTAILPICLGQLELLLGFWAVSIPGLLPLLNQWFPKLSNWLGFTEQPPDRPDSTGMRRLSSQASVPPPGDLIKIERRRPRCPITQVPVVYEVDGEIELLSMPDYTKGNSLIDSSGIRSRGNSVSGTYRHRSTASGSSIVGGVGGAVLKRNTSRVDLAPVQEAVQASRDGPAISEVACNILLTGLSNVRPANVSFAPLHLPVSTAYGSQGGVNGPSPFELGQDVGDTFSTELSTIYSGNSLSAPLHQVASLEYGSQGGFANSTTDELPAAPRDTVADPETTTNRISLFQMVREGLGSFTSLVSED